MSLSKCLNSDSQNRDSFSERFHYDYLAEDILQYLSLEDKLRLECVSKQFQRTLFKSQNDLKIRPLTLNDKGRKNIESIKRSYFILFKNNSFNLEAIESLLKKCPNIKTIELIRFIGCNNYNRFIRLIIKYCNNLVEFRAPLTQMSEISFNDFRRKFRSKMKTFQCIENKTEFNRLNQFPNLEELEIDISKKKLKDHTLINSEEIVSFGLQFNKLKKLRINSIDSKEKFLIPLIEKFKTIRYLDLNFRHYNDQTQIINNLYYLEKDLINSVSNLKDLIHLKIENITSDKDLFTQFFEQLKDNCEKLTSVELNMFKNYGIMSEIKSLPQLKRFTANFSSAVWIDYYTAYPEVFRFFSGFSNLTHLSLNFISALSIHFPYVKYFENIDIYLPKLQYLEIKNWFLSEKLLNKSFNPHSIAEHLSQLSNLKSIKITFLKQNYPRGHIFVHEEVEKHERNMTFIEELKKKLSLKCKKIRIIDVNLEYEYVVVVCRNIQNCLRIPKKVIEMYENFL